MGVRRMSPVKTGIALALLALAVYAGFIAMVASQ